MPWYVIAVAGVATLGIYTILYRENPISRLFEHVFVGLSAGYLIVATWTLNLEGKWWNPMVHDRKWYWVFAPIIGLLFYVILSMFVAGLMIGRTPEFMGKKFGPYEMAMAMIAMLGPMICMVILSAVAVSTKAGLAGLNNPSSHGLTEVLYAYTSGHGNNGSAFAGLNANTVFYNVTIGIAMIIGRFATVLPALAVAGSLAEKKIVPESSATFPTTGLLFIIIVISVIFIMGALTFFPVYSLGPILEQLFVNRGTLFRGAL